MVLINVTFVQQLKLYLLSVYLFAACNLCIYVIYNLFY